MIKNNKGMAQIGILLILILAIFILFKFGLLTSITGSTHPSDISSTTITKVGETTDTITYKLDFTSSIAQGSDCSEEDVFGYTFDVASGTGFNDGGEGASLGIDDILDPNPDIQLKPIRIDSVTLSQPSFSFSPCSDNTHANGYLEINRGTETCELKNVYAGGRGIGITGANTDVGIPKTGLIMYCRISGNYQAYDKSVYPAVKSSAHYNWKYGSGSVTATFPKKNYVAPTQEENIVAEIPTQQESVVEQTNSFIEENIIEPIKEVFTSEPTTQEQIIEEPVVQEQVVEQAPAQKQSLADIISGFFNWIGRLLGIL